MVRDLYTGWMLPRVHGSHSYVCSRLAYNVDVIPIMTTKANKHWVVVLDSEGSPLPGNCYLGEYTSGVRSGVRRIENAVRFTLVGAKRIARSYTYSAAGGLNARTAKIAEVSRSGGLTSEPVYP